jgi:hypothetical protein
MLFIIRGEPASTVLQGHGLRGTFILLILTYIRENGPCDKHMMSCGLKKKNEREGYIFVDTSLSFKLSIL